MQRSVFTRARVLAVCLVLAATLGGCESFDPTTITDWIPDSKKKLPGERKEVFPNGVPGVVQGVPPELVKGKQPPPEAAALAATEQPEQKVEEKPKPKPKPKTTARPRKPPTVVTIGPKQGQQQQPEQPAAASPWPATPDSQPAQSQSQSNWPAAPAPGSFSR